jgi:hypothetical protein
MHVRTHLSVVVFLFSALSGCQSPKEQPKKPVETAPVPAHERTGSVNASPTGEHGIYQVFLGMERITQVRIVPTKGDAADGRTLDPGLWSYDQAKGLPQRAGRRYARNRDRPRSAPATAGGTRLQEGAVLSSVRVIVGDHLGVEGTDYSLDRSAGLLRLLGPDTPESRLRYYIQYSLRPDPEHPELAQGVAFGNRGDMDTVRRLLGIEPR